MWCVGAGVLRPDARDPVAQVGRQPRLQRRRQGQEAQENQVQHIVGARGNRAGLRTRRVSLDNDSF